MTAYDRASQKIAKNKSLFSTEWLLYGWQLKQYKKQKNIVKINTDATYAPAYKAQAQYNKIFPKP